MALTTIMFLHSSRCLLDAWKLESHKDKEQEEVPLHSTSPATEEPVEQSCPLSYPELAFRSFGTRGEALIKLGIAAMQSGVCLTYLIFVPHNLRSSVQLMLGVDIGPQYWLVLMILIQIPLSWIRDISHFMPTNSIANFLILYGLVTCLGFAVMEATRGNGSSAWQNVQTHVRDSFTPLEQGWFLFIGTSVLLFEGSITLLIPLQESVQGATDRARFSVVYKRVILSIVAFYAVFGLTCWLAFGKDVNTVLTTSLPEGFMATAVQLAYSIAVIFTFPLQNYPALEIATQFIAKTFSNKCCFRQKSAQALLHHNVISSILVCLLALVAVTTMESLDKVVSLMGSLLGCPIAFVFPPLIHTQLDPNLSVGRIRTNYLVAGLGFVSMVLASIITILQWRN